LHGGRLFIPAGVCLPRERTYNFDKQKSIGECAPILAAAVLDQLKNHCHVINISENSYRLNDKLKMEFFRNKTQRWGNFFWLGVSNYTSVE
jgi:hypothetical protein